MKNLNTPRTITTTSVAVANRKTVTRTINDVIALASIESALAINNGYGKVVVNESVVDLELGKAIRKGIHTWFKAEVTEEKVVIAEKALAKIASGNVAAGYEYLDSKLNALAPAFTQAVAFLRDRYAKALSFDMNGVMARVNGGKVKVTWLSGKNNAMVRLYANQMCGLVEVPHAMTAEFTAEDFGVKQQLWGRVMLTNKFRKSFVYKPAMVNTNVVAQNTSVAHSLWSVCDELTFSQAVLVSLINSRFDIKSLVADRTSFYNLSVTANKEGKVRVEAKSPMLAMNKKLAEAGFWGTTGLDAFSNKGIAKAFAPMAIWSEVHNGKLMSTEKGNKTVARMDKLAKDMLVSLYGETYGTAVNLGKTLVVVEWVGDVSERVKNALSTGVYYGNNEDYARMGAIRFVSNPTKLGMKATMQPVAQISEELAKAGYGLTSFGSVKAGINGLEAFTGSKLVAREMTVNILGEDVTFMGLGLNFLPVVVTNWYSIQMFRPVDQDKFNMNKAELLGLDLDKVLVKTSLITDDGAFVDYVLNHRDVSFEGNLAKALWDLLAKGEIERKPSVTQITPTEYDVMALSHGYAKARAFMWNLLRSPLNAGKAAEMELVKDFLNGQVNVEDCYVYTVEDVLNMFVAATLPVYDESGLMVWEGTSVAVMLSGAPNRNGLVTFVNLLYRGVGKATKKYIKIVNGKNEVNIPTGKFFEGQTFKSNPELDNVVASGFLDKIRKYLGFGADLIAQGGKALEALTTDACDQFIFNVRNELESCLLGKGFGKLNAVGGYHVLGVAPWLNAISDIAVTNVERYVGEGNTEGFAVGAKMPLWTLEAHAGFRIVNVEMSEEFAFLSECVAYVHPLNALALQNDSDGDLYRLTFHKGFDLELFKARVLSKGFIFNGFFNNYVAKEMSYADKAPEAKELKAIDWADFYQEHVNAAAAKKNVALFTSKFFLFAQAYGVESNVNKGDYQFKAVLAASFIQTFAMNSIKHNSGTANAADMLYASKVSSDSYETIADELVSSLTNPAGDYNLPSDTLVAGKSLRTICLEFVEEMRNAIDDGRSVAAEVLTQDRDPAKCGEESYAGYGVKNVSRKGLLGELLNYFWK